MKSDERSLGDGDFVAEILSRCRKSLERHYALRAGWIDMTFVAQRVATLLNIDAQDIWRQGNTKELVRARSLLCFRAVRELGMGMAAMARRLNLSTVAVSKSVVRGAEIVKREGLAPI
jgi:putative transposase